MSKTLRVLTVTFELKDIGVLARALELVSGLPHKVSSYEFPDDTMKKKSKEAIK